jgi:5-methyltetrahydrofolate--homocysteine methyltransferase
MEAVLDSIYKSILQGDIGGTPARVQEALDEGLDADSILQRGMVRAMTQVGRLFEQGEYFVPEMLISAHAMNRGLQILKPHLVEAQVAPIGTVVIGTVQGDLHDIGKNLVIMMLEGVGFDVHDLGTDVSATEFVETVRETSPDIVAMSALLTTTMPKMKATIEALIEAGLRDRVRVIIGGAPVTDKFAEEIGADGYAPDASRAAALAGSLVS